MADPDGVPRVAASKTASGNASRLPEAALERLMCRAVFSASLVASCVWICFVRLPEAAPQAASVWRLPEPLHRMVAPGLEPPAEVHSPRGLFPMPILYGPNVSALQLFFVRIYTLGRVRFWNVFSWFVASLAT